MNKIPFSKSHGTVDVKERLRILNKKQRHAVLSTDAEGQPYPSLVAFAVTPDSEGVLFATPKKTSKIRNILRNSNVSLMIDTRSNADKAYMQSEAVAILGSAMILRKGKKQKELSAVLVRKHPRLKDFVMAESTALVLVKFKKVLHTGGFQKVTVWEPGEKELKG